jgi:hypothetical protein
MSSSEEKSQNDNSEDEEKSKRSNSEQESDERKNDSDEGSEKNSDDEANKSDDEEKSENSQANKSDIGSEQENKSKTKIKIQESKLMESKITEKNLFDQKKLVLTNEIKIDVVGKNNDDVFMTNLNLESTKSNINLKQKTPLSLISEINSNLDDLFQDLSKTIKTFNDSGNDYLSKLNTDENKYKSLNYSRNNFNNSKNKKSQSPEKNYYPQNEIEGYNSGFSEKNNLHNTNNQDYYKSQNKKFYTDKETNTGNTLNPMMSSGNNPMTRESKERENFQTNRDSQPRYTPTNPYHVQSARTPNHIRTVEDLYRHNKIKPIIYTSNPVNRKEMQPQKNHLSKKYFEGEPEAYNSGM